MYRKLIKPREKRIVDLLKSFDLPVMIHSYGSSSWVFEDFIEMGINTVDALQPEAANMNPDSLVERFGGRIGFHGCISTAGTVVNGTPEEMHQEVKRIMGIMKQARGFMVSTAHHLQDDSSLENILAYFQTAFEESW